MVILCISMISSFSMLIRNVSAAALDVESHVVATMQLADHSDYSFCHTWVTTTGIWTFICLRTDMAVIINMVNHTVCLCSSNYQQLEKWIKTHWQAGNQTPGYCYNHSNRKMNNHVFHFPRKHHILNRLKNKTGVKSGTTKSIVSCFLNGCCWPSEDKLLGSSYPNDHERAVLYWC